MIPVAYARMNLERNIQLRNLCFFLFPSCSCLSLFLYSTRISLEICCLFSNSWLKIRAHHFIFYIQKAATRQIKGRTLYFVSLSHLSSSCGVVARSPAPSEASRSLTIVWDLLRLQIIYPSILLHIIK